MMEEGADELEGPCTQGPLQQRQRQQQQQQQQQVREAGGEGAAALQPRQE